MKPSDFLTELSTEKLAQYKTAAGADATKADKAGDFKRGDKRFKGINTATKKQFDNDAKKVDETVGLPYPGTYEDTNDMFKGSGQRRIGTLTTEEDMDEGWSQKYKNSINCSHPKGFSQKAHCAGKNKHNESIMMEMTCPDCGMCQTHGDHENLDEACWKGYHKEGNKKMFGKTYPNCVKNEGVAESELDKFKKYTRPVVKTEPKIERTTNPAGRTTDHVEWKVTSPTGEIHRYKSKKQAQEHFDSFGQQGVAEGDMYGDQEVSWEKGGRRAPTGAFRNPHTSALGRALYRDLSKQPKLSPQQVQRNKERWAQRQAEREQGVAEEQHSCPHCSGEMVSEELMNEKKDACYYKVKSRYKVWPSAYASGALVKCRKKGADGWGNGGKKNESSILEGIQRADESLHDWFNKEKWVRMDTKGNIKGPCAKEPGEGKPKCLPQAKAHSLGKKGRASAAARKRREDPNPDRSGKAINVNTKKKTKG